MVYHFLEFAKEPLIYVSGVIEPSADRAKRCYFSASKFNQQFMEWKYRVPSMSTVTKLVSAVSVDSITY